MIAFAVVAHAALGLGALLATFAGGWRYSVTVLLGALGVAVGAASIIAVHSTMEWRGEPVDGVRLVIAGVAAAAAWSIVVGEARGGDGARGALCGVACSSLTWAAATEWAVPFALAVGVLSVAIGLSTRGVGGTSTTRLALAGAGLVLAGGLSAGAVSGGEWSLPDAVTAWPWAPAGAGLMAIAAGTLAARGSEHRSLLPMVPTAAGGAALAMYGAARIPDGAVASSLLVGALVASALVARPRQRVGAAASASVMVTLGVAAAARPAAGLAAIAGIAAVSAIAWRRPGHTPTALLAALLPPTVGGVALIVGAGAAFDQAIRSASMSARLPWIAASMLLPVLTGASILVAGSLVAPSQDDGADDARGALSGLWLVVLAVVAGVVPTWLLPRAPDPSSGGAGLVVVAIGAGAWLAWWMKKHRVLPAGRSAEVIEPKHRLSAPRALPVWLPAVCDAAATVLFIATAAVVTWATLAGARAGFL
ncbi:MAG TPA: hypothetical protein VNC78_00520 [Actinomycetota bacterium]|nr:hypothetical protein [Actinomycetota bacterium]